MDKERIRKAYELTQMIAPVEEYQLRNRNLLWAIAEEIIKEEEEKEKHTQGGE